MTAATFAAKAASLDGDVAFAERAFGVAIKALASGGKSLNAIGEFSAPAKRTLEFARPLYVTRVAVSWELARH
ncbi:hypothetical protein GRI68_12945 [Altererythrobacter halimionae]|uniref:Uncharacterized protein n=1 Tax=Alteriqipengyuania halimionae TaxID=1926630 RepID=A0A6I4U532_9SPHN|nr:hypothetical protein [Alteriqipengyuania halimionae]